MTRAHDRVRTSLLALLLVVGAFSAAVVLLPSAAEGAVATGPNPPLGVHLSYLDDPTKATITWHTAAASTSRAEWGRSIGPPYPFVASGFDYTSPNGTFLHVVNLTGLLPGATYYYRIGNSSMASTFGQASFRAAPPKGGSDTFTFGAAGDWGNSTQTADTSLSVAKRKLNLFLPTGDLYYSRLDSVVQDVYKKFQVFGQSSFVMSGVGDNEWGGPGDRNTPPETHCAFSNLPGNERTYAFTFGNTLFMTVDWGNSTFDKDDGFDGTVQPCAGVAGTPAIRAWIDERLAEANRDPTILWKIVFQHHLCYDTTTTGFGELCIAGGDPDQIEDIFTNRGVDLVLMGNDHTYGRTHPVKFLNVTQTGNAYNTPGAPIYFVLGTGGEAGTGTCRTDTWVAVCRAATNTRGFGWFEVSPTAVRYEFVENSAGVVDSFTLTKAPSRGLAASANPSSGRVQPSGTTTSTVTVLGASSTPVSLGLAGCPTGGDCRLSVWDGTVPLTTTLSVSANASTPEGTYRVTIIASNATTSATAPFEITVARHHTRAYQRGGDGGAYSETDDAYINSGLPATNYGTNVRLNVDGSSCLTGGVGSICKTLIEFPSIIGPNAGQIPPGARILTATLELGVTNTGRDQDLYQLMEPWSESTVTWNSLSIPGLPRTGGVVTRFNATPDQGRASVTVTSVVQDWAHGDPNEGFLITSPQGDRAEYHSSESTLADRPKLTVVYENATSAMGPILYYDMQTHTVDGKMEDLSGNGHHGAITGTADTEGVSGRARDFPNPAGGISTNNVRNLALASPLNLSTGGLTLAFWASADTLATQQNIVYVGVNGTGERVVPYMTASNRLRIFDTKSDDDLGVTVVASKWYHVAITYNTAGRKVGYVNGVQKFDVITTPTGLFGQIGIGNDAGGGFGFDGKVDEMYLYSRALSGSEISGLARNGSALILHYDMESLTPDGRMRDLSGQNNHGVIAGTTDVAGKVGRARQFVALNDSVAAADSPSLDVNGNAITIAAWIKRLGEGPVIVKEDSFIVGVNGGVLQAAVETTASGGWLWGGSQPVPVNEWTHIGFVYTSGTTWKFYVNGALRETIPPAGGQTGNIMPSDSPLEVGKRIQHSLFFWGTIDEVLVFSRGLSDAEVSSLASSNGPVLSYDLESLLPDGRMNDLSGNGNHGTISGTTDVAGKIGRARQFSSLSDSIAASDSPSLDVNGNAITIAAWIRRLGEGPVVSKEDSFIVGVNGGVLQAAVETTAPDGWMWGGSQSVPVDEWTHIAFVYNAGTTWNFYLNGVLRETVSPAGGQTGNIVPSNLPLEVGKRSRHSLYFWGTVDEVSLFSRALTDAEVSSLASSSAGLLFLNSVHSSPPMGAPSASAFVGVSIESTLRTSGSEAPVQHVLNRIDAEGRWLLWPSARSPTYYSPSEATTACSPEYLITSGSSTSNFRQTKNSNEPTRSSRALADPNQKVEFPME